MSPDRFEVINRLCRCRRARALSDLAPSVSAVNPVDVLIREARARQLAGHQPPPDELWDVGFEEVRLGLRLSHNGTRRRLDLARALTSTHP